MPDPVFAFLAFTSGSFEGAIIRDMRLANALHRRGHRVVVYWMMERNAELLDRGIEQRVLCTGMRWYFKKPSTALDWFGRAFYVLPPESRRVFMQHHPDFVDRIIGNFITSIARGGAARDTSLVAKLEKFLVQDRVTHLMPTFAMICPFAQAVKMRRRATNFEYLVTFQGEEIFANFAHRAGCADEYHKMLNDTVAASAFPAVAVSRDYIARLSEEMSIDPSKLRPIYPGIEWPDEDKPLPGFEVLAPKFKMLKPDLPIVTYIGRQDAEKGIDLLLYATRMLLDRGVKFQLVISGGSSFGENYRDVLRHISEHLRLEVHHRRRIPDVMRDALYRYSRCIVYPSIHREPFGMVAAEAMSRGTPVIVPDIGGITEAIEADGLRGGLTFRSWDSADLARQIERILTDNALHAELSSNTKSIARNFTVERMTDQVLAHLGLRETAVRLLSPEPSDSVTKTRSEPRLQREA